MGLFKEKFGDEVVDGERKFSDGILSTLTSLVQVGELIGALLSSYVGNTTGRRGGFIMACLFITIGAITQVTTQTLPGMAAGRVVLGKCCM